VTSIDPEGETTIGWTHYVYPESKLLDAVCVVAGYGLAEIIYFRDRAPSSYWGYFLMFVVIALIVTLTVSRPLGLYGQRPHDSWADKANRLAISGTIVLSVLATANLLGRRLPFERVPMSVVIAGCVLATFGMGLVRMSFRLLARMLEQGRTGATSSGQGVS
jgi:FlaA1/EpsC-like NDP-sugar epimerase